MKFWGNVQALFGTRRHRREDELAFLPAALEIVETPPSPIGRAIALSIVAFFAIAIAWACIGTIDIVAIAPGKIIPSGRIKTIQPFETGVVRAIHARDGQRVRAGEVLIELDPTMTEAELGHLNADLLAAQLEAARLRAALTGKDDLLAAFHPPPDASVDQVEMHRRFLVSEAAEQTAKLAAIDGQIAQKEAECATIEASIDKLNATITPLQERVDIRRSLDDKRLGSRLLYLEELQDLLGERKEIAILGSRYNEANAAVSALLETHARTQAEYERGLFDRLAKADQKVAGLTQDIIRAEQRTNLQRLTAPEDGVVQQLAVHTVGGVVTPAQSLMIIVPANAQLEIEAMISNQDIGFVEVGQEAAIKVEAFNFTRYGILYGKVVDVSHDAVAREAPGGRQGTTGPRNGDAASGGVGSQDLVYIARVALNRERIQVEGKFVSLSPGMAVTVEVKTGVRTVINYLLSPLIRYQHEGLRER